MAFELVTGHAAEAHITAEQVSRFIQGVTVIDDTTVYRLNQGNNAAMSVNDLTVSVDTGEIILHGFHNTNENPFDIVLDATVDASKSRIDKIVLEILQDDPTGIQYASVIVVQGEEASTPVEPATPSDSGDPTITLLAVGLLMTCTISNTTITSFVDNTELYAGSYVTEEDFEALEDAVTDLENNVNNQTTDQYSDLKSYAAGEYTIHDNILYKCITSCSPGPWATNSSCFTPDTLTNAVTTLNSDLTVQTATLKTTDFPNLANNAKLRKSVNTVEFAIDGFKNLVDASSVQVCTLPEGFRPTDGIVFPIIGGSSSFITGRLSITSAGIVSVYSYNCASGQGNIKDTLMFVI